jgi:hypothetical protein
MAEKRDEQNRNFSSAEGLSLTLDYLEDPSDIECPACGPDRIEVVGYVDAVSLEAGDPRSVSPDDEYAVILYCHGCERGAALHLSYRARPDREAA